MARLIKTEISGPPGKRVLVFTVVDDRGRRRRETRTLEGTGSVADVDAVITEVLSTVDAAVQ